MTSTAYLSWLSLRLRMRTGACRRRWLGVCMQLQICWRLWLHPSQHWPCAASQVLCRAISPPDTLI